MPKCQFTSQYYEYEIGKNVDFHCQELPLASGFCIFHDKDYLQDKTNYEEHKTKVLDRLTDKVNHAISNNEPLLCIGFQLPDFNLSDLSIRMEFTKPVYFSRSQFFGKADFSGAKFKGNVDFTASEFNIALFSTATFQENVFFLIAKFQEAHFYVVQFKGDANFFGVEFNRGTSFFEAKFQAEAMFITSHFYGKTHFAGLFNGKTVFNYVLFEEKEKVIFDIDNLSNVSFMNTDITGGRIAIRQDG